MLPTIEGRLEILIGRLLEEVWVFVSDIERLPNWLGPLAWHVVAARPRGYFEVADRESDRGRALAGLGLEE